MVAHYSHHEDLLEVPGATGGLLDGVRKPSRLRPPVANPALNPEFQEGKKESHDAMDFLPDEGLQWQLLQQMPSGTPQEQAWALLQKLEELHEMQELQEPPRLPSEGQQEILRIIKELQEELQELLRQLLPDLQLMQELHL